MNPRDCTSALISQRVSCPYCGEFIDLLVDCSVETQQYTEDCQVCCQPMIISTHKTDTEEWLTEATREDDTHSAMFSG